MLSDEWTTGSAVLLAWTILTPGVVYLIEPRPQLRYSFARVGMILTSIAAFWLVLLAAGVAL